MNAELIRGATLEPLLEPAALLRRAGGVSLHELLGLPVADRILPTYSATTAIYQGLRMLGVGAGDRVLVPDYNCGHEVEAVLRTGAEIECYRVGADLSVDIEDLRRLLRVRPARVVLVTHYFGFPQPLDALLTEARRAGALILEDCAHGLFSADACGPLGTRGDLAVFSFRKSLPVPVGGALVLRAGLARPEALRALPPPPWLTRTRRLTHLLRKSFLHARPGASAVALRALGGVAAGIELGLAGVASATGALGFATHDPDDERYEFPRAILEWGMGQLSLRLVGGADPAPVRARRRDNFARLRSALGDAVPLPALGQGVAPLYCVFAARERSAVLAALHGQGVPALDWWSTFHPRVDWSRHPEAARLKRTLVAVPVHQDLAATQVDAMAAALTRVVEDRSRDLTGWCWRPNRTRG